MPAISLVESELVHACRILFGADLQINTDFLEYLQISGVKSAYRRKALETHPDRMAASGSQEQDCPAELFREVQQAYQDLTSYLDARERGYRLSPTSQFQSRAQPAGQRFYSARSQNEFRSRPHSRSGEDTGSASSTGRSETFYKGALPQRPLLFGHFLYYSGLITWRMIIRALLWQRTNRPRLGQLGQRFGWLTPEEVLLILRDRRAAPQPFGKSAINLGLLDERQVKILLLQQQRLQKKIGEFFLEQNILTPAQLQELLARYQEHNARIAAAAANPRFQRP